MESLKKYVTKMASSFTALCGMSDMPLLRQGVAALNATPPGQWHIKRVG